MKNRAKCKKCNTIIESMHRTDYQTCTCNEISVYGGPDLMECGAINWSNFVRVDDLGNEISVKVSTEQIKENITESNSKKAYLNIILEMIKHMDNLPQHAMQAPINHYDYQTVLVLLSGLFKDDLGN